MLTFDGHLEALAKGLKGKDPKKTNAASPGCISLLLYDRDGTLHRGAIRIGVGGARVAAEPGGTDDAGQRAIVRGPLEDWVRFMIERSTDTMGALELYGDPELITELDQLLHQKLSPLGLRVMAAREA